MKFFVTELYLQTEKEVVYNDNNEEKGGCFMKYRILALILMLAVLFVGTIFFLPSSALATDEYLVAKQPVAEYSAEKALEVRFENILNRNFSYNEEIADIDALVNNSVLALLDKRDAQDDSFIDENIVADFIYDMYGIDVVDFADLNADMPKKNGFVYIIPRGYSVYTHDVIDIIENEDGTFSVTSRVLIDGHENNTSEFVATTLFVKNANSSLGYNIIYSNIIENTIAI